MNFFDLFINNNNDEKITLRTSDGDFTVSDVKKYVFRRKKEFENIIEENIVITAKNNFDFIVNFWAAIFAEKKIYIISDEKRLSSLEHSYFKAGEVLEKSEENPVFLTPKIREIVFYTSGSSGNAKSIVKNSEVILQEAYDTYNEFKDLCQEKSVVYTTSEPTHMFILTFYVLLPFLKNFIIDTRKIEYPEQLEERINEPSLLITTPAFLETLQKYSANLAKSPYLIFTAGNFLKKETHRYFEKMSKVINIYGSTETGNIAYNLNADNDFMTAFNGVEICHEDSILVVKSPFFIEDKIKIADKISIFENGKFLLEGRADRMVKISDKRVSLIEQEEVLSKSDFVSEVCCLKYEEKLCAAIVLSDKGKDFFLQNDIAKLKTNLKKHMRNFVEIVPSRWKFLYEIKKNERGKIDNEYLKGIFGTKLSLPLILAAEKSQNEACIKLLFPKSSNFFEGHFKVFPIVPGVVQLHFAKHFIEAFLKTNLPVWQIKRIKFSNIIKPDTVIFLKLIEQENAVLFEFLSENNELLSSGSFAKLKQKNIERAVV